MCGYPPISRVMLLCALALLGVWVVLQPPSQGIQTRALGKPICTLLHVQGLMVGTSHEGFHPTLYSTTYCQGGELSTVWDQGNPVCLPACPRRDLGFCWVLSILVGFVCFAGYEEATLSFAGSCCSLWAWMLIQGDGRGIGKAGDTMGAPWRKGLWDL